MKHTWIVNYDKKANAPPSSCPRKTQYFNTRVNMNILKKYLSHLRETSQQAVASVFTAMNYTHTSSLLQLWICPRAMEMYTNITI